MTSSFRPLPVQKVAEALAALPAMIAADATTLSAVRHSLGRAIASGQDPDQLAQQLSTPGAWLGVNLRAAAGVTGQPAPPVVDASMPPPAWALEVAQAAVQAKTALRAAIVDRNPATVTSLSLPAWSRGQQALATYGPITVSDPQNQISFQKWVIIFVIPVQMVSFVQGTTTLFVAPVAAAGHQQTVSLSSGSVWVNVNSFAAGASANSYAGLTIEGGTISSDAPLVFGAATVTIPAGASLTLTVTPAPSTSTSTVAQVTPPSQLTFSFPHGQPAVATFTPFVAQFLGQTYNCTPSGQPAVYSSATSSLAFPAVADETEFGPTDQAGSLVTLSGSAPIEAVGWALWVTVATPDSLGNAVSSGIFYLGFGTGVLAQWVGLVRPEPEAGGVVLASTGRLLLWTAAGLAPNTLSQQKIDLWQGRLASSTLTSARLAGAGLVYEVVGLHEVLELGTVLSADLDRPLLADGNRVPAIIPNGLMVITKTGTNLRVIAYAFFTAAEIPKVLQAHPDGFPVALDNAFLKVSAPLLLVMEARLQPPQPGKPCISDSGALLLGFLFQMEFPFFPDPYTSGSVAGEIDVRNPLRGLLAEVIWTQSSDVALRLVDLEHQHPTAPPGSEASSDLVAPAAGLHFTPGQFQLGISGAIPEPVGPTRPFPFSSFAADRLNVAEGPGTIAVTPPPPAPPLAPGLKMLDLSTRASQFGVEIIDYTVTDAKTLITIDGLSARTAAILAPIITLPAISWEPMFNQAPPGSETDKLLHPPDDGPLCALGVDSVTLVPVSPLPCLEAILTGTQPDNSLYGGILTLPFGMVAGIAQLAGSKGGPGPALTRPSFEVPGSSGDVSLTGAYQLTLKPRAADTNAPVFTGATFLRTQEDNPTTGLSYGEQVLGDNVAQIFSTRFTTGASPGVPVKRYDLSGFGASLFSDWTDLNPPDPTDIIQVDFTTTVGRTSHEIVQAQSVIYPWGIKVVRTITIDRLSSGSVERTDSGWLAASDGLFQYVATASKKDIKPENVHRGVIDSLLKVHNIQEFGLPLKTSGTDDNTGTAQPMLLQPVTFDAEIAINPQHAVLQGGALVAALDQTQHVAVPSTGVIGYIGLTSLVHLSLEDLLSFLDGAQAGGPLHSTLNIGKSDQVFRTVTFSAEPAVDTLPHKAGVERALVIAANGLPTLPQGSAWTVALQGPQDAAPRALDPTQPIPVIQPNDSSGSPGPETHYADPADIFRLGVNPPTPPANLYGFLQDVNTQKTFLAQPFITNVTSSAIPKQLSLRQVPSLADPGTLLGAISSFPVISSALLLQGLENLASSLGSQSLAIDKWFDTDSSRSSPLISNSVCQVNLKYEWAPGGPTPPTPPGRTDPADPNQNIHITLGKASGPSWSIDIYGVALQLVLPPISSEPALWIEGSFHADAESLPSFPDLQVWYDGPLAPLTKFFSTLQKLASFLGPGGATPEALEANDSPNSGSGLDVHFANGTLTVQDTFALPQLPLGPGYIEDISLDLGASIDIVNLEVGFLAGIGSPAAPVHWIVDPLSGTGVLQAGVQDGSLAVLVQLGLGLGLAIDLGVASGGASIVIAFQVQVTGQEFELLLLLTGQAQVTVLGGLAAASLALSCGLGLEFPLTPSNPLPVGAIGTASVAIHLSICWVISIDWSGSWSFSHTFEIPE